MLTFKDKLPPVNQINLAVEDKNVIGALLLPLFMKSIDYVDPDGALAEIQLPSRKRQRGFGQGALSNQPVAKPADGEMDTTEENANFDSALPEKERNEIKLAMVHVENEFVVLNTWKKNFNERFPKCNSFVMVSDVESKTVEPAGMIVLFCLGVVRSVGISHVMVKFDGTKHKNKTSDEKCEAFVELQLTRGSRELAQLLKQAKEEEKKAKNLFTEEGQCGDPFGDSL